MRRTVSHAKFHDLRSTAAANDGVPRRDELVDERPTEPAGAAGEDYNARIRFGSHGVWRGSLGLKPDLVEAVFPADIHRLGHEL
jgi:hypothetical protein